MSHDYHEGQANYSPGQVLHDGCDTCTYRSNNPDVAIQSMDINTFTRAWERATKKSKHGLPDASAAELPVLDILWSVQLKFGELGVPIGMLPAVFKL